MAPDYISLLFVGYIPLRFYRVGTSFGNDSVWCVKTFRDITERNNDQIAELRHTAATVPQLPPICTNEEILNVLDDYNYKRHPNVLGTVCIIYNNLNLLKSLLLPLYF